LTFTAKSEQTADGVSSPPIASTSAVPDSIKGNSRPSWGRRKLNKGSERLPKRPKLNQVSIAKADAEPFDQMDEDDVEDNLPKPKVRPFRPWAKKSNGEAPVSDSDSLSDVDGPGFRAEMDFEPLVTVSTPPSATIDPSVPEELISLMDLNTSPMRKYRAATQKRKDYLARKVLQEPTIVAEETKCPKGLEDLDEDGGGGEDDFEGPLRESGSDDDWESDAEGWKALSGSELDGLD